MSIRGLIGAFAVLSGVGTSLVVPKVSSAGQLTETMTATTISGQLHSNGVKGIGSVNKSRGVSSAANDRRAYENEVIGEDPGNYQGDMSHGRVKAGVDSANAMPFNEKSAEIGKTYSTDGLVVEDKMSASGRLIIVVRIDGPNKFQAFGFRPHDRNMPEVQKNANVRVTARYVGQIKEPASGSVMHAFDNAVFAAAPAGAPAGAPGATGTGAAAADKEEKPTFNSIMKGWAFRGTVQMNGKATGVFVNDTKVKYAQVGTLLAEGVRVSAVGNGNARVLVDGNRFDVTPW